MITTVERNALTPLIVVGFPKSGSTWLARMLADITQSNIAVEDDLDVVNAADNSPNKKGKFLIYKLHDGKRASLPHNARIVYIIRDVRDVLVSAFFFNNQFISKESVSLNNYPASLAGVFCRAYFRHQVRRMNRRWCGNEFSVMKNALIKRKNRVGAWDAHIAHWTHQPGVVVIKFEDLLRDTAGEMRKVISTLSIEASDDIIQEAVLNQAFENRRSVFLRSGDTTNARFLRSGAAGNWKAFLTPSLAFEIEKKHARAMIDAGYKLEFYEGKKK